jgi:rod shape determining protein RodA
MFDRRLVQNFDWGLLWLALILGAMGLVTLYSGVTAKTPNPHQIVFKKQLIWYGIGIFMMIVAFLFDYKYLERWANVIYALCILLLIGVLVFGKSVSGSQRWLIVGPVSIQPSEMVKIAVIITLAQYYSKVSNPHGYTLRELVRPFLITALPFVLIVKQPDLGTAMLVGLIAVSMTIFVKIEKRSLLYLAGSFTIMIPLIWFLLKPYQKERLITFFQPDRDPLGAGYHIIQSKIAVGSGMITGKGFLKGTQNALSFLPEQHTDFIFTVLAEEWGFAGAALFLFSFMMLIIWGLYVAHGCREAFGAILAVGITANISWQAFINIGMVMGLMPVVGVPLPFISYGGSSIISMMICIGILLNVRMRRFMRG